MPWCQTPSRKKKAVVFTTVTTSAYQGSRHRIFKIRPRVLHTETVIVATFPCTEMWSWMKRTVIGCLTCRSNDLMGEPWPIKAAIYSRLWAVSLKVWLHETSANTPLFSMAVVFNTHSWIQLQVNQFMPVSIHLSLSFPLRRTVSMYPLLYITKKCTIASERPALVRLRLLCPEFSFCWAL